MELLKLLSEALGPGGLGGLISAMISSIGPGGLTAILIIGAVAATRQISKINSSNSASSPTGYVTGEKIIDKLMKDLSVAIAKESECSKKIEILTRRIEVLEQEKAELASRLEKEKAELSARIDALFGLFRRGNNLYNSEASEDEIGKMRRWMFDHLSEETLIVIAADSKLSPPRGQNFELQILSVVEEARRLNLLNKLAAVILEKTPTVKPW